MIVTFDDCLVGDEIKFKAYKRLEILDNNI